MSLPGKTATLKPLKQKRIDSCKKAISKLLREVNDADPDSVIVFYMKDHKIYFRSEFVDRLEVIGALEAAKQEVWSTD